MKAGIVEIPDIIAVTKSDLGNLAVNTHNDVINSIKIGDYSKEQDMPVILISSKDEKNIDVLINKIEEPDGNGPDFIKRIKAKIPTIL